MRTRPSSLAVGEDYKAGAYPRGLQTNRVRYRWLRAPATTFTEQTIFSFPTDKPVPKPRRIAFGALDAAFRAVSFRLQETDAEVFGHRFNICRGRGLKQRWGPKMLVLLLQTDKN
jgi:hypothetical protein